MSSGASTEIDQTGRRTAIPKPSFASRLFGYDIFLSFALGPPPRGTRSYASDLARRLRERDFNVFFSEDEVPPGEQLDSTLRSALQHSKTLVVIANRDTLREPRWVRTEVEEFRRRHPDRPVIPINIGGALQDPVLASNVREWLDYEGKIWLDETDEAADMGIANERIVERLATSPMRARSNAKWRWLMRGTITSLTLLAIGLGAVSKMAMDSDKRARTELDRAVSLRLVAEATAILSGARAGSDERAMLQVLAACRIAPSPEVDSGLLNALLDRQYLLKLKPVGFSINAAAISPDGTRIALGSDGGIVRLWDAKTLQGVSTPYKGHQGPINRVVFRGDGGRFLTVSHDKTMQLWSPKTGEPIGAPLQGHTHDVNDAAFSPDGTRIASGSEDGTLGLWDGSTGQPIGSSFKANLDSVSGVAFSPDGLRVVYTGKKFYPSQTQAAMQLWEVVSRQFIGEPIEGPEFIVSAVAFSPDGRQIVSSSRDNTLRRWNALTGEPIGKPMKGHENIVSTVAFSPDGKLIVSGSWDNTLQRWDAYTGEPIGAPFKGNNGSVQHVAFSPDGTRIVSDSSDGSLRVWSAQTGEPIGSPLPGHTGLRLTFSFGPDSGRIFSASDDGTLRIWGIETAMSFRTFLQGHAQRVFSPDGTHLVSGSDDRKSWDALMGQGTVWVALIRQYADAHKKGHSAPVLDVAFSADGAHLVSSSEDRTLRFWDAETGQSVGAPLKGHSGAVRSVAFSPDSTRIVSGGDDGILRQWDAETGKTISTMLESTSHRRLQWDAETVQAYGASLEGFFHRVMSVAFSPDGTRIVSGGFDEKLRIWDGWTGQPIGLPLQGHSGSVGAVAFSPDGTRIISGSVDGTLRLWDVKTRQPVRVPLEGHKSFVQAVAFSPDGRYIVSAGGEGVLPGESALRIWETKTGRPVGIPLKGHKGSVRSVAFSPDGKRIVSGGDDGTLRFWPAPKAWPDELCMKLTRNMSRKEWNEWVSPEIAYACQCPGLPITLDVPTSTTAEVCPGEPAKSMFVLSEKGVGSTLLKGLLVL